MKKISAITLASFLLFHFSSFGQNQKTINEVSNFAKAINGKWILKSYVDTLRKTMSPLIAQQLGGDITQLFINSKKFNNNTLYVDAWSLHEGGLGFSITFKKGVKKNTFKTDYFNNQNKEIAFSDIGIEIKGKDSLVVIYQYNKLKKVMNTIAFIKPTFSTLVTEDKFLDVVVNQTIITGTYSYTQDNISSKIVFTNEGTIKGLTEYTNYEIRTFTLQTNSNNYYDQIYLLNDGEQPKGFILKVENKKIFLFEFIEDKSKGKTIGALKYTFNKN